MATKELACSGLGGFDCYRYPLDICVTAVIVMKGKGKWKKHPKPDRGDGSSDGIVLVAVPQLCCMLGACKDKLALQVSRTHHQLAAHAEAHAKVLQLHPVLGHIHVCPPSHASGNGSLHHGARHSGQQAFIKGLGDDVITAKGWRRRRSAL